MSRLIDADKIEVRETYVPLFENCRYCTTMTQEEVKELIKRQPTVDAVPVVRCRDCKYAHMTYNGECKYCDVWGTEDPLYLPVHYFCASGEPKEVSE